MHPPTNRLEHQSTSRRHLQGPGTPRIRYEQNQQERCNRHPLSGAIRSRNQWTAVRSCQQWSETARSCQQWSGTVTNCQDDGPPVLCIGVRCERRQNQTQAKSSLPIGTSLHVPSHCQSRDHPFLPRASCNPQSTQAQSTTPCMGRWVGPKGGHLPELPSKNVGALT